MKFNAIKYEMLFICDKLWDVFIFSFISTMYVCLEYIGNFYVQCKYLYTYYVKW